MGQEPTALRSLWKAAMKMSLMAFLRPWGRWAWRQAVFLLWASVPELEVSCVRKPSFALSPAYLSQALVLLSLDPKIWRTNYFPALPAWCVPCLKILPCFHGTLTNCFHVYSLLESHRGGWVCTGRVWETSSGTRSGENNDHRESKKGEGDGRRKLIPEETKARRARTWETMRRSREQKRRFQKNSKFQPGIHSRRQGRGWGTEGL